MQAIYFDMDGTIADLYSVPNWLEMLHAEDETPYKICKSLVPVKKFSQMVKAFQAKGVTVGVISWSAMGGSNAYTKRVKAAKMEWFKKTFNVPVNEFHVVKYGTPKHSVKKVGGNCLLVDDSKQVRAKWNGETLDATNTKAMMNALEKILANL